jgi:hypothetical protein
MRWTPSGGWSSAVSTATGFVQVAAKTGGNAIGVAYPIVSSMYRIEAVLFSPSTGWGSMQGIDGEISPSYAIRPSVGIDGSGNALVAYNAWSGTSPNEYSYVRVRPYSSASGLGTITTLAGSTTTQVYNVKIAVSSNGDAALVWGGYNSGFTGPTSYWASYYTPAGGWGAAAQFNLGAIYGADIGIDATGRAIVVMANQTAPASIWWSRNTGSGWSAAAKLSGATATSIVPILAINASGDAVAAWTQGASLDTVAVRFSASSGTWGSMLTAGTGGYLDTSQITGPGPTIAMDGSGNALIVWYGSATPSHVWASRLPAGSTTWTTTRLDTGSATGDSDFGTTAACTPAGHCFAAWGQYDTSPTGGSDRLYVSYRP